jgi:hypothetical protein
MRRSKLASSTCRLDVYVSPEERRGGGDQLDFAKFSRTQEELKMSQDQLLKMDLRAEENGWSSCYKHVMSYGR